MDNNEEVMDKVSNIEYCKAKNKKLVFMFAGQGTQYYLMGKELYETNRNFKRYMDACSDVYQSEYGVPLTEIIYDEANKTQEFDSITDTHPALFSIGYSLANMLIDEGIKPSAVLGHSLGEYIAAVVAGVMSYDDVLRLLIKQSQLIKEKCSGGLMIVLAPVSIFSEKLDIFKDTALAGVNYNSNFVISGSQSDLEKVSSLLDQKEDVLAIRLPVKYSFHSEGLSAIENEFMELAKSINIKLPSMEIYSSALAGKLHHAILESSADYLWRVVREKINFDDLISNCFSERDSYYFVDLSASGSIFTFLKYGRGKELPCSFCINQFGDNKRTLDKLRQQLETTQ
ncbi:acyltransferase domain-containing protein [Serratia proteamaculans]